MYDTINKVGLTYDLHDYSGMLRTGTESIKEVHHGARGYVIRLILSHDSINCATCVCKLSRPDSHVSYLCFKHSTVQQLVGGHDASFSDRATRTRRIAQRFLMAIGEQPVGARGWHHTQVSDHRCLYYTVYVQTVSDRARRINITKSGTNCHIVLKSEINSMVKKSTYKNNGRDT